jgi:hypothetical protein
MKKLAILATLAPSSIGAAHAASTVTLSEVSDQLSNNENTYISGFLTGVVFSAMNGPQVCSGKLVAGAVKQQLSAEISRYVEKNPATNNKTMEITDVPDVLVEILKADYPCK